MRVSGQADLREILKVTSLLDRCAASRYVDPSKLEGDIKKCHSKSVDRAWEVAQKSVEKLCPASLKRWRRISSIGDEMLMFWVVYLFLGQRLAIESALGIYSQVLLLIVVVLTVGSMYARYVISTAQKRLSQENLEEVTSLRRSIQELIFHLVEEINARKEDPNRYKIKLHNEDYQGVLKRSSVFGGALFVPSIVGIIVSSAKRYVRIIDPYASFDVLQILSRASRDLEVKLITSKRMEKTRRFPEACDWLRRKKKFDCRFYDLDDLENKYIISDEHIWKQSSKEKMWSDLSKDRKSKEEFEQEFEMKWQRATPLRIQKRERTKKAPVYMRVKDKLRKILKP